MGRKSPQQFIKRQKEMARAQKAKDKMAKRQSQKNDDSVEPDLSETADQPIIEEP